GDQGAHHGSRVPDPHEAWRPGRRRRRGDRARVDEDGDSRGGAAGGCGEGDPGEGGADGPGGRDRRDPGIAEGAMSLELIRGLYDYHRWANRRLFDVATALGEELSSRDAGKPFSFPTVKRMFGHLYGADWVWLSRWKGLSPTRLPGAEFPTLASIRAPWDDLEREQGAFVEGLRSADLDRVVEYKNTEGTKSFRLTLWP